MQRVLHIFMMVVALVWVVGCDSNDNGTVPAPIVEKFTHGMLDGNTYVVNSPSTDTVSFTADDMTETVDGMEVTRSYTLNDSGEIVANDVFTDTNIVYRLVKKESDGLHVDKNGTEYTWTPIFTHEMIDGKTYTVIESDGTEKTYSFTSDDVTITEDGVNDVFSYEINDNGEIVIEFTGDIHHLLRIEDNGDLIVEKDNTESKWIETES